MGGGLAFLNKKSWHTGSIKQVEAVWKKEQEHAKEQQKVKELQKQIEEERERDDLHRLHESGRAGSSGKKPKSDRVEFMYNTPLANRAELEREEQQAFLLGEKKVNLDTLGEKAGSGASGSQSKCELVSQLPSAYTEDTPQSRNEQWQRLQNDPLFAIKRQQQSALAKVRKNPVKMQAIRNEVREARRTKRKEGREGREGREDRDRDRHGDRHGDRERDGERDGGRRRHHHHRRRHHHKSSSSRRERRSSSSRRHHKSRSQSRSRSRSRSRSPTTTTIRPAGDAARAARDEGSLSFAGNTKDSIKKKAGSYGLMSSEGGISGTNQHTQGKFDARARIREAARAQERDERERETKNKAWGYGGKGKTKHRVGQVDEKEKQRRLEEMMGNAQDQGKGRREERERKQREEDERERQGVVAAGKETFLDTFQKNVYGANPSKDVSLQDAIGRRKFYSQR